MIIGPSNSSARAHSANVQQERFRHYYIQPILIGGLWLALSCLTLTARLEHILISAPGDGPISYSVLDARMGWLCAVMAKMCRHGVSSVMFYRVHIQAYIPWTSTITKWLRNITKHREKDACKKKQLGALSNEWLYIRSISRNEILKCFLCAVIVVLVLSIKRTRYRCLESDRNISQVAWFMSSRK